MTKDECLDPETIAAWMDGGLTDRERAAAEQHAADCDRCLAVLAAIAKTTPPPVVEPARSWWFGWRLAAPLATAAIAITTWALLQQPASLPQATPASTAAPAPTPAREAATDALRRAEPPAEQSRERAAENRTAQLQKKADRPAGNAKERADTAQSAPAAKALQETTSAAAASPPVVAPESPRSDLKDKRQAAFRDETRMQADIPTSDPNVRWRIAGRSIQRSMDAGKSWQTQNVPVPADPIAGAAPGPSVCWIVGRQGLVLLTTDGATWRRIEFPDPRVDLVGVSASDALTATITAADGKRYGTVDGGRIWTLQEIPATPF
jgi:hypothetical protein